MQKNNIKKMIAFFMTILITISLYSIHVPQAYGTEDTLITNIVPENSIKIEDSLDLPQGESFDLAESYASEEEPVKLGGMEIVEPEGRKIIAKSVDDGLVVNTGAANGFQSEETEYNVHLLYGDRVTVTEEGVSTMKTFITLNLNFYEDTETVSVTPIGKDKTVGTPAAVEYFDGGIDPATAKPARTATVRVDVTNASQINIKVEGDTVGKEDNTYIIYLDQHTSLEDDPLLKVRLEEDQEAGQDKYILKTSLQRTNLLSAQATIKVTKGALEFDSTRQGTVITGQAITNGYSIMSEDLQLDYLAKVTEAEMVGSIEADQYDFEKYDYFTFTIAPTEETLTSQGAVEMGVEKQVLELYMKKTASFVGSLDLISDWDPAEAGNMIFDQSHIFVYGSTKAIKGEGVTIKGQFKAYNKNLGMEASVKLYKGSQDDMMEKETSATLASEQEDGTGRYTFTFEFEKVVSGEYRLVIKKPGHTKYTVKGINVSLENIDWTTTLPEIANPELSNMSLVCGDLDGDDSVKLLDRDLLMSTKYVGTKVTDFSDTIESGPLTEKRKAQIMDLDGDGYIKLSDLNILMSPANYGKGPASINFGK